MRHTRRRINTLLGMGTLGSVVLGLATSGCKCSDDQPAPAPATSSSAPAEPVRLSPLTGPVFSALDEDSAAGAAKLAGPLGVWAPVGAEKPRPIVVVLGAGSGEPQAALLSAQLFDRLGHDVFVMSVGAPPSATQTTLRAALTRLKARFGAHVAKGSVLLVATSAYAAEATNLLREEPKFFARALLFDFDPGLWSSTLAYVLNERGAERVLFTTSEEARRALLDHAALMTQRAGTPARVLFVGGGPPAPEVAVTPAALEAGLGELGWLLSGDERFPKPPAPPGPPVAPPPSAGAPAAPGAAGSASASGKPAPARPASAGSPAAAPAPVPSPAGSH